MPTLSFAGSIPCVMLTVISAIVFKQMRLSNADITLYTAWLYLPWVMMPLWEPLVVQNKGNHWWIVLTEALMMVAFGGMAFTIPTDGWLRGMLLFLWLLAFASAVHDTAGGNYRRLSMATWQQPSYQVLRSPASILAMVLMQGVLVMLAGNLQVIYRNSIRYSWSLLLYGIAGLMMVLWLWHHYALLRRKEVLLGGWHLSAWKEQVTSVLYPLIQQPQLMAVVGFLFLFRVGEGLQSKVGTLFLIDATHRGGLGLSPQEYGLVMGTVGVFGLCAGAMAGWNVVHRNGLSRWRWPMAVAVIMPTPVCLFLSNIPGCSLFVTAVCILFGQASYGFGMTAYVIILRRFCRHHRVAGQALVALSLMLPSMFSGAWQQYTGYRQYFMSVLVVALLTQVAAWGILRWRARA